MNRTKESGGSIASSVSRSPNRRGSKNISNNKGSSAIKKGVTKKKLKKLETDNVPVLDRYFPNLIRKIDSRKKMEFMKYLILVAIKLIIF